MEDRFQSTREKERAAVFLELLRLFRRFVSTDYILSLALFVTSVGSTRGQRATRVVGDVLVIICIQVIWFKILGIAFKCV